MQKINYLSLVMGALGLIVMNSAVSEELSNSKSNYTEIKEVKVAPINKGFIENISEIRRKKFFMCDEFLNVRWIDVGKGIGYSIHDVYRDDKKVGQMKSLVYMKDNEALDKIDVFDYEKKGELEVLFNAIKKGQLLSKQQTAFPTIKYNDYVAVFQVNNAFRYTYANNQKNICIFYPDENRVWLVETKLLKSQLKPEELDNKAKKLSEFFPGMLGQYLGNRSAFDINGDGVDDYLSSESYIFSEKDGYRAIGKLGNVSQATTYFIFGVKGTDRTCKVFDYNVAFLVSDGKNYFLNNQCNLTELATH